MRTLCKNHNSIRTVQTRPVWPVGPTSQTGRPQQVPNLTVNNSNEGDQVCQLWKIPMRLHGTNLCINCTILPVLHQVSCNYKTIPNAHKHFETHQNMRLGSNGVDQVRSLRKITTWLPGTNFCINCTSSPRFAPSFHAVMKQSQMPPNTMKHTKTWV